MAIKSFKMSSHSKTWAHFTGISQTINIQKQKQKSLYIMLPLFYKNLYFSTYQTLKLHYFITTLQQLLSFNVKDL
jgi:hypothetical protein